MLLLDCCILEIVRLSKLNRYITYNTKIDNETHLSEKDDFKHFICNNIISNSRYFSFSKALIHLKRVIRVLYKRV